MIDENSSYSTHVEELKVETTHLKAEIQFLKQSLVDVKRFAKQPKPCTKTCVDCKGKTKVGEISLEVTSFDQIMTKLDSIYDSIEAKSVPQTVFVKAPFNKCRASAVATLRILFIRQAYPAIASAGRFWRTTLGFQ